MPSSFTIDDFGGRIATVWSELRPATRGLVERAVQAAASGTPPIRNFQYDARADLELSRFLAALDDRAAEKVDILDPETGRKLKSLAEVPVLIRGGVRIEEGANPKFTVNDINSLEDVKVPLPKSLRIRVPLENASAGMIDELHLLFSQRRGEAKVLFDVEREGDFMVVMEAEGYNVLPDRAFIAKVEELCGRGAVRVIN